MVQEIREQLFQLSEESYKDFNRNIVPGEERMIGVRLPALRKLARETAKSSGREYLDEAAEAYVKYPKKTRKFLESGVMDEFTHNKSIQKIRESYRVSREEKEELKKLKKG